MASCDRVRTRVLKTLARFGRGPSRLDELAGGANSRVFAVETGGARLAAKAYLAPTAEGRSRLDVEHSALSFLTGAGEKRVPRPLAADGENQVGLYEFIDGGRIGPPGDGHLEQAAAFLESLRALADDPRAQAVLPASASFLSPGDMTRALSDRLRVLATIPGGDPESAAALAFATRDLAQAFGAFASREPRPGPWTLSPSDFGFHNALIRPGGELCFLDFEYFGRDDPAKLLCDLLLHPGNRMDEEQRFRLARVSLRALGPRELAERAAALYPLAALMWCAILLNPFLPGCRSRERPAARGRLEAARAMLDRARRPIEPGDLR